MPKKKSVPKKKSAKNEDDGLWVAARYSLKGPAGDRAWDSRRGGPPQMSRFLELADIALGQKRPATAKIENKSTHQTTKKEPYSTLEGG
jgi:hypothetical protein